MQTRVLQNWQPSNLESDTIRTEFRELFKSYKNSDFSFDSSRFFRVRNPDENREVFDEPPLAEGKRWHRDDAGEAGLYLMWSNIRPTEIMFKDKSTLTVKEGDIILLDNLEAVHRFPTNFTRDEERWFIRVVYVERWWKE